MSSSKPSIALDHILSVSQFVPLYDRYLYFWALQNFYDDINTDPFGTQFRCLYAIDMEDFSLALKHKTSSLNKDFHLNSESGFCMSQPMILNDCVIYYANSRFGSTVIVYSLSDLTTEVVKSDYIIGFGRISGDTVFFLASPPDDRKNFTTILRFHPHQKNLEKVYAVSDSAICDFYLAPDNIFALTYEINENDSGYLFYNDFIWIDHEKGTVSSKKLRLGYSRWHAFSPVFGMAFYQWTGEGNALVKITSPLDNASQSIELPTGNASIFQIIDETLYLVADELHCIEKKLYSFDLKTNKLNWSVKLPEEHGHAKAIEHIGDFWVLNCAKILYRVDPTTGALNCLFKNNTYEIEHMIYDCGFLLICAVCFNRKTETGKLKIFQITP